MSQRRPLSLTSKGFYEELRKISKYLLVTLLPNNTTTGSPIPLLKHESANASNDCATLSQSVISCKGSLFFSISSLKDYLHLVIVHRHIRQHTGFTFRDRCNSHIAPL